MQQLLFQVKNLNVQLENGVNVALPINTLSPLQISKLIGADHTNFLGKGSVSIITHSRIKMEQ